jgi:hypothetical protein
MNVRSQKESNYSPNRSISKPETSRKPLYPGTTRAVKFEKINIMSADESPLEVFSDTTSAKLRKKLERKE